MKRNANQTGTVSEPVKMFMGFKDLYAVHGFVGADPFKYTIAVMKRLAKQIGFCLSRFDEFPIQKENRFLVVVHKC